MTDALTFRWSNKAIWSGYRGGPLGGVLAWWAVYALMTAALFAYFSPLFYR